MTAILRHIKTGYLYRHIENDKYRNCATGVEGIVDAETAKKIFVINIDATELCNEYPNIEKLIKALNLNHAINNT